MSFTLNLRCAHLGSYSAVRNQPVGLVVLVIASAVCAGSCCGAELISYFKFDGNVNNEVNGVPMGEPMGRASFSDGVFGSAIDLDGVDSWIDTTAGGFPNANTGFFEGSITLWVRLSEGAAKENIQFLGNLNSDPDKMAFLAGTNGVGGLQLFPRASDNTAMIARDGGPDGTDVFSPNLSWANGQWHHIAYAWEITDFESVANIYIDGEPLEINYRQNDIGASDAVAEWQNPMAVGGRNNRGNLDMFVNGTIDDLRIFDGMLTEDEVLSTMLPPPSGLMAGDADMDLDFDQLDLVRVQIAGKYLTGQAATWGDGDWDGAPGGMPGSPPAGDGLFNHLDIIAALQPGIYLTGSYAAVAPSGAENDGQTSIVYDPRSGELAIDPPAGMELTSINIDSAAGVFADRPVPYDGDPRYNIFKATFGTSFGYFNFGKVAQPGLSKAFLLNDLTVAGSLVDGGNLGDVDLVYVPEPTSLFMMAIGFLVIGLRRRDQLS